jgi:hypothetical protein
VILIDDRTILQKDIGGLVLALLRTYGEEAQLEWEDRVVYLRGR